LSVSENLKLNAVFLCFFTISQVAVKQCHHREAASSTSTFLTSAVTDLLAPGKLVSGLAGVSPTTPTFPLFSPRAAHCLSAPPGAKRESSHRKSALKTIAAPGDEQCVVKRKTLS